LERISSGRRCENCAWWIITRRNGIGQCPENDHRPFKNQPNTSTTNIDDCQAVRVKLK
jgi:hypothetical protein